jgi:signal transduction histidine kinase
LLQDRHDLLQRGSELGASTIADHLVALTRRESSGILLVTTTDRAGVVNWSTAPDWEALDLSDRVHIRVHFDRMAELFISVPLVGRVSRRWSIQMTYPVHDAEGQFAGVSVVSVDPLLLSSNMAEVAVGEGAVAALLRLPDGALLARSRDAEQQLGRAPSIEHPAVVAAQERERGVFRTRSAMDGRELIMAFRRVHGDHLVLAYAEDWAGARHVSSVLSLWASLSFALVMLLLLAGGLMLLRALGLQSARTELAHAQALRAATMAAWARLEALLEASPVVMYAWRYPGPFDGQPGGFKPAFLSPNLPRVLGWNAETFGDPEQAKALMDDAGWDERLASLGKVLNEGSAVVEYRWRWPDGTWRWLREEARLIDPSPPAPFNGVGYLLDVTQERQAQARAAASERLNMLGDLAANMAHEFNQPLAVIALAAENAAAALELDGDDGILPALETLELIAAQATRCKSLVQHLRVFSQPGKEQALSAVHLQSVIEGALLLVNGALRDAEVALELDLPAGLPLVRANSVGAEQVLVNILLNARDVLARLPPGQERLVSISIVQRVERVQLIVGDTGGGIPVELLGRVFEPFFTTKDSDKGTGLGLAICQTTMRGFGGDISVRNGQAGAEFVLDFVTGPAPVQPAASGRIDDVVA